MFNFKSIAVAGMAAVGVLTAFATSPSSAAGVKVGTLTCEVAGGVGFIIGSSKKMQCTFNAPGRAPEMYVGRVDRFGVDIGVTGKAVVAWGVFAPTGGFKKGALAGAYGGAGAEASVGVGVGANALIGGNSNTIQLQPLSVQAQTGLDVAGGITTMTLEYVGG
ncbi:hypothetical protein FHS85_003667 [Rhodoligotrophos appendicifer]|uniref:DUF992 domain-containing protein n=1 Tax=Rhodoligotrophos appendicifer TaxID=987056 RepID=UPI001FECE5EB|nr:DUF992 domain-containing protein [Rhodoligotrophos appendicifer]